MSKTLRIIQREYTTRVRKKSFIIMTFLTPVLFALLMVAPVLLSRVGDTEERTVAVVDSSSIFDYTKILREVTALNTRQLEADLVKLSPAVSGQRHAFEQLAGRLDALAVNRDPDLADHIKRALRGAIDDLRGRDLLTRRQADSVYERHSAYYDLLIREFENIRGRIPDDGTTRFEFTDLGYDQAKELLAQDAYHAVVFIPKNILASQQIQIYSKKPVSMDLRSHIRSNIERAVENQKMVEVGISLADMSRIKTKINAQSIRVSDDGQAKESRPEIAMILGYIFGFVIYMAIFLFGSMVMNGVVEEKSSRIVEVILSSVRPTQLMAGKIIGVGLVGLTQFTMWIVLTVGLVNITTAVFAPTPAELAGLKGSELTELAELTGGGSMQSLPAGGGFEDAAEADEAGEIISMISSSLESVNLPLLLAMFIFYFLGGYLLYGALFAAVGSAVDNEADTQQFVLPITLPMIAAIIVMLNTMRNPEGIVSYWFSIIPFTSPVVMLVRLPYGVPAADIIISALLLVATLAGAIWVSAKIYRTGILRYGSKTSWRDLWKWMRY